MPNQSSGLRLHGVLVIPPPSLMAALFAFAIAWVGLSGETRAEGEPAEEFLNRLRSVGYFDTAIAYLDRLDSYPGVDPELKNSIDLEKAQTYIAAAIATRNTSKRDQFFVQAEEALSEFLKQTSHSRRSEARLQLGKLQMVRAAQLLSGEITAEKREAARQSYLEASQTFDTITEKLRSTLKDMQGANIDPEKDPEAARRRERYRGEFLQALTNAGQSRYEAAKTYPKPAEDGQTLLNEALAIFTDLSDKYDSYVQGAIAMLHRGQVQELLGNVEQATDSYLRMLEQPDAAALRDAKFQATAGLTRLYLQEDPPRVQASIDRGQPLLDDVRPNERSLDSVQQLKLELAKAYIAKSNAEQGVKAAEKKRSATTARQLLIEISRLPGDQAEAANQLLAGLGINRENATKVEIPEGEEPESLDDALSKSRDLLSTADSLKQSLSVLEKQAESDPEVTKQKQQIEEQLLQTRAIAVQTLRRGLALVTIDSDKELVNQARQLLAYLLYQRQQYRDSLVVGSFLARHAPGTEVGLRGGLLALNSLQLLLVDEPDNDRLIQQLQKLGDYLTATWPDNPEASAARGVMVKLALRNDRWEQARKQVAAMPEGAEQAYYYRLMGQLLWNESLQQRQAGNEAEADQLLQQATDQLKQGLEGIESELVDPEGMQAALILAKAHLRQGDIDAAASVLDHETYGPITLMEKQGPPDDSFASDLYGIQLQVTVQQMSQPDADSNQLLTKATDTMNKLKESVKGKDSQQKLTAIYLRMAQNIRDQLETAAPAVKSRLTEAFRVFLENISGTTNDVATLQWVGQTLLELGEASMQPNQAKAVGPAKQLLESAVSAFEKLKDNTEEPPMTVDYLLGKTYRMLGRYKDSVDTLKAILSENPMMLNAQTEAALAYEQWAPEVPPKYTGKFYEFALQGAKPGPDKKNIIWGWGKISQLTSRNPKFRETFFEARYHVALCRYLWGKAIKNDKLINKAASDITSVNVLFPEMGGPQRRADFDRLLKRIQKDLGKPAKGLPKPAA